MRRMPGPTTKGRHPSHWRRVSLYQLQLKFAIHRMFTLPENMLLFTKPMRKYELEPVL
jgi:hypothetical protein